MDALTSGTKREIVRRVFPELRYGGDPDVERYFELRSSGRMSEALAVYNGRLRVRYPDDSARIALLGLYRARDPRYASFQDSLILACADHLIGRIRANIDLIVRPLEGAELGDALGALKTVEALLARLGGESEGAIGLLERYASYAAVLGYRTDRLGEALALLREYDTVSRSDAPSDYDFVARSAAIEDRRKAAEERRRATANASGNGGAPDGTREEALDFVARSAADAERRRASARSRASYFDPAKIKFTAESRALVEIPRSLSRREDKVLAFCAKYWIRARDPVFERTVFLYARKYGTRHYEIFRTIKLGRARGSTDDEILSAVSAILVTRYDYSLSGDLYMQVMWRRLKARMQAREVAQRLAKPGPESKVRAARAERTAAASARGETLRRLSTPERPPVAAPATARSRPAPAPERPLDRPTEAPRLRTAAEAMPVARSVAAVPPSPDRAATPPRPATIEPTAKPTGSRLLARPPSGPAPLPALKGTGSVSDKVRALSGRTYDVYRELFLAKVREHIHQALLASPTRTHGIFDTAANEAEDHIYGFMVVHYDDPFMDWPRSAERDAVESLGFAVPSLDPIIEACFRKLR